jgi:hypothetical protein
MCGEIALQVLHLVGCGGVAQRDYYAGWTRSSSVLQRPYRLDAVEQLR